MPRNRIVRSGPVENLANRELFGYSAPREKGYPPGAVPAGYFRRLHLGEAFFDWLNGGDDKDRKMGRW